jgi:hypothetical protein
MADDKIPNSASGKDGAEGKGWSAARTDEATGSAAHDAVLRERPAGERAPRRYDHADDPALPSDDAALETNI